jgi:hypothetical protein
VLLSISIIPSYHYVKVYEAGILKVLLTNCSSAESRSRVVYTPASNSGGPRLKSRPRRPVILIAVSRDFPQSLRQMPGS